MSGLVKKIKVSWIDNGYNSRWIDEFGNELKFNSENFRCYLTTSTIKNIDYVYELICIYTSIQVGGGHGEPRYTEKVPEFFDNATLRKVNTRDTFLEVSEGTYNKLLDK